VRDVMIETLWPTRSNGMLLGPDKAGKSYYAFEEALCLVMQWKVLGRYAVPKARRVLYITEEDDQARAMERLYDLIRLHGAAPPQYLGNPGLLVDELANTGRLTFWAKQGFRLEDPAHVEEVERFVRQHGIDVVYLDALSKVASYKIERTEDAGRVLGVFDQIENAGAVLRPIHHTNKAGRFFDTRSARDGAGSYAIPAWNRAALLFSKRTGKVIAHDEGSEIAESPTLIGFEGTDGMTGRVCVMVQRHLTKKNPTKSQLIQLRAEDPEAAGRFDPKILAKVEAVLRDPATPRFLEPNTGLRGVTTLTVAQRAQLGEDAAAKKKALRYIKAVKSVREVPPPMGASFARGTQLWEIVA
jgi:hypothetical protein